MPRSDPATIAFVALAVGAILWIVAPFAVPGSPVGVGTMLLLAALAVGLPGVWRGRAVAVALATVGLAAFAAGARFDGSFAWLPVGFQTDRYPRMSLGKVVNVPAILGRVYGWSVDSQVPLPGGAGIEMRALLRAVAMGGVALVALAMARATPRRGRIDANLLVALPAAWLVLYATLPQMHERYLLWASATSALLATRSIAGLLAHLLLTLTQVTMLLYAMIESKKLSEHPTWATWYYAARGLEPTAGYAIALMACVLIAWALTREPQVTQASPPA